MGGGGRRGAGVPGKTALPLAQEHLSVGRPAPGRRCGATKLLPSAAPVRPACPQQTKGPPIQGLPPHPCCRGRLALPPRSPPALTAPSRGAAAHSCGGGTPPGAQRGRQRSGRRSGRPGRRGGGKGGGAAGTAAPRSRASHPRTSRCCRLAILSMRTPRPSTAGDRTEVWPLGHARVGLARRACQGDATNQDGLPVLSHALVGAQGPAPGRVVPPRARPGLGAPPGARRKAV